MKVKINVNLIGVDGKTSLLNMDEAGKKLTLRDVIYGALLVPDEKDQQKEKWEKYEIFKKIRDVKGGEVELSAEEITVIKKGLARIHPPLVMGQAFEMLEGTVKLPKDEK